MVPFRMHSMFAHVSDSSHAAMTAPLAPEFHNLVMSSVIESGACSARPSQRNVVPAGCKGHLEVVTKGKIELDEFPSVKNTLVMFLIDEGFPVVRFVETDSGNWKVYTGTFTCFQLDFTCRWIQNHLSEIRDEMIFPHESEMSDPRIGTWDGTDEESLRMQSMTLEWISQNLVLWSNSSKHNGGITASLFKTALASCRSPFVEVCE